MIVHPMRSSTILTSSGVGPHVTQTFSCMYAISPHSQFIFFPCSYSGINFFTTIALLELDTS